MSGVRPDSDPDSCFITSIGCTIWTFVTTPRRSIRTHSNRNQKAGTPYFHSGWRLPPPMAPSRKMGRRATSNCRTPCRRIPLCFCCWMNKARRSGYESFVLSLPTAEWPWWILTPITCASTAARAEASSISVSIAICCYTFVIIIVPLHGMRFHEKLLSTPTNFFDPNKRRRMERSHREKALYRRPRFG